MIRQLSALVHDQRGVTIVEFAMVSPVLMLMLMGLFDLSYNMYTTEMLQGAIEHAARNSSIEGAPGKEAQLDAMVTTAVHAVAPAAALTFTRRAYSSFTKAGRPEDYSDVDGDGTCDNGESFEDAVKSLGLEPEAVEGIYQEFHQVNMAATVEGMIELMA